MLGQPSIIRPMLKKAPLLLEIGTEEIPPSFLAPGVSGLERRLRGLLEERGVEAGAGEQFHTPRRFAVRISDVALEVPGRTVELQGPPKRAAFDADGKPTKTAIGFSKAHGLTPADLFTRKTDKGEYVFLSKETPAIRTLEILKQELPARIAAMQFPKMMRWLEDKTRFPRPVRWLVCLLGDEVAPFEYAGLVAGRETRGLRGADGPVALESPGAYEEVLRKRGVLASPVERRRVVERALGEAGREVDAEPVPDEELLAETVNITEQPVPVLCRFDADYLELPAEVLVTALKKHQRCFALRGRDGALVPRFVAFADNPACDREAVARWYDDAADSRLRDARFFFEADMKRGLAALVEEEKRVSWFEGMGSYFDKTVRLRSLCRLLAETTGEDAGVLDRAAELAKADLLTDMVREKEFTSLQGMVGGTYARLQGEPEAVAAAIAEQYLPVGAGGRLPATRPGALLGIADRLDNITATFLAGAIPTGSEDPFALRRQAAGLITVILEQGFDIDLARLVDEALGLFPEPNPDRAAKLAPFLQERLAARLAESNIPYDIAGAVIETTWHRPREALAAARALQGFRDRPEFEKLIIGQKRVANILKDQHVEGNPDPKLFAEEAERDLYGRASGIEADLVKTIDAEQFDRAFELLLGLRAAIDRLFDDVLVMDKDEKLRANRLRLLGYVRSLFRRLADLSRIVLEGEAERGT